ncbi:MAG: CHASE2 domain-containing protein [Candidatus Riflebacteria bacterium]|nr:CHASE2 domain-containing protein [Candidatus Riflebacteria bacterium]
MSISAKLSNIKSKLSKFFFRKDKNYTIRLIALVVFVIVFSIEITLGFTELERYLQALIYQIGYQLPKDPKLVTVVKKDETSSSLLNMDINNRHIHSSMFKFLGQRQKRESPFKSRSQSFDLLTIKIGLYEKIRNQRPISTSWNEWNNLLDESENKNSKNLDYYDQDKWKGDSKQVSDYFKKTENKDKPGFTSFIKVTGNTWKPRGQNLFKVLAGGSKYLIFPTLCVDWDSKQVKEEIENLLDLNDNNDEIKNSKKDTRGNKSQKQSIEEILTRFQNLLNNLGYAEMVYEFRLFPTLKKREDNAGTEKNFFTLTLKLKTYGRDTSYWVEPASVIGFDFVLQGEKTKEYDQELANTFKNIKSKVVLAARRKTESIEDEGARDEGSFTQMMKYTDNNPGDSKQTSSDKLVELSQNNKQGIVENIFIKPYELFLENKNNIDYAMIDMTQGSKSYITEAPVIIMVDEKVYDANNNLIATQTIKPSFALKIALEKLDYDNKFVLPKRLEELKKTIKDKKGRDGFGTIVKESEKEIEEINKKLAIAEPSYIEVQKKVFEEIREDFCKGKFNGLLKIKDLEIPLSAEGRIYINYAGSTRKGNNKYAGINSVSYYEALDDNVLKEFLKKNPDKTRLDPNFAHRRTLGKKMENKGERVYIAGPFEATDFDFYPTPVSYPTGLQVSNDPLMGIEIHANIIMNLLNRNFIRRPNFYITLFSLIICCIVTAFVLEIYSPVIGTLISLVIVMLASICSYFSYHLLGQVVKLAPLLTAILSIWFANTLINYLKQRKKANTTKAMFSKFVSADVVQYMLDNPDLVRPGGTKTELTIFFSDVAGFTTISEGLSPEDLVILLNEYLGAMTDLLFEYGGTLDKFIGDAVMAFWNFPKKQEDHAVKAVLCAIAMQKKIKELQIDWARRGFPKVAARCGINTQDVVVGYMGSQKAQMNFTCMGDGVNLASRLEGANKEYGTMMMVSDNTYQRVKHAVRGRFLDFLAVKGKKEPVKVHELVCKIGDEPEGWFEKTELYDKAIQLHLERKWDEAIATFEEVLKLDPNDGPSKTYITRCNEYKVNPPPEGWDGRYILTHK